MIKIYVGSSLDPKEVIVSPQDTPAQVYEKNHIPLLRTTMVTLNGMPIRETNKTLAELGVNNGDMLVATEKLASA